MQFATTQSINFQFPSGIPQQAVYLTVLYYCPIEYIATPLRAWSGPLGFRWFGFPLFVSDDHMEMVKLSAL
jgi:hypothetical protein